MRFLKTGMTAFLTSFVMAVLTAPRAAGASAPLEFLKDVPDSALVVMAVRSVDECSEKAQAFWDAVSSGAPGVDITDWLFEDYVRDEDEESDVEVETEEEGDE